MNTECVALGRLLESITKDIDSALKPLVPMPKSVHWCLVIMVYFNAKLHRPCRLVAGSARWRVVSEIKAGEHWLETGEDIEEYFGNCADGREVVRNLLERKEDLGCHIWLEAVVSNSTIIIDPWYLSVPDKLRDRYSMEWPEDTKPPNIIVGRASDLLESGWEYKELEELRNPLLAYATSVLSVRG